VRLIERVYPLMLEDRIRRFRRGIQRDLLKSRSIRVSKIRVLRHWLAQEGPKVKEVRRTGSEEL